MIVLMKVLGKMHNYENKEGYLMIKPKPLKARQLSVEEQDEVIAKHDTIDVLALRNKHLEK